MARVIVSPRAKRDVDEAIGRLSLPADTWTWIARALRVLETFPLSGPELGGRGAPTRFVLGPWSWMLLLYSYDEVSDRVFIVSVHDGRSANLGPLTAKKLGPHSQSVYTVAGRSIEVIGGQFPACGVAMTSKPCLS